MMTSVDGISGGAVDPRLLKQLLLTQFTAGIDPFAGSADAVTAGGDGNLFSQLLSQYMMGTDSYGYGLSGALNTADDTSALYSSLGLSSLGLGESSSGYGLSFSSLGLSSPGGSSSAGLLSLGGIASSGSGELAADGSASTSAYDALIRAAADRYGIDPALIKGVIQAESGFKPGATSAAGAKGLMQLMDGTAAGLGVTDSYDPAQNIDAGSRYLSYLLRKYDGSEMTALAAYNAGPGRVDSLGLRSDADVAARLSELPAETQGYIGKVLSARRGWSLP